MLKSNGVETLKSKINNDLADHSNSESESSSELNDEQDYDELDNDDDDEEQVKALFSGEKNFKNVIELFQYEANEANFNLVEILNRFNMNMIDYIKMINFIRSEVKIKRKRFNSLY